MESPRPTRKQPVSVDDMMERLKARPASGGSRTITVETVDGETREVRKKRKRRSHQPKKVREARVNKMKRLILFGLLPLVAAMIIGWYLMVLRYKGESFRENLSRRASEVIGLKTAVSQLSPDGFSVGSRRILMEGRQGAILKEIEAMDLKASLGLGSHFSSDWKIASLSAQTCKIHLQEIGALASLMRQPVPESGDELMMAGLGLSDSPGSFDVDFLRIGECSIFWHPSDEDMDPYPILTDALLTASDLGASSKFMLTAGRLTLDEWPPLDIEHGKLVLSRNGVKIDEVRIQRESFGDIEGIIKGSGTIGFGGAMPSDVTFQFKQLDVRDFLPAYWQDKVIGKISGDIRFRSELGKTGTLVGEGDFEMPGGVLGNLPSLKRLSTCAGDANLARVVFENGLSGKIRLSPEGLELYEIEGKSGSLFRMRGNVTFGADGRVSGEMEVGISEEILLARRGGIPPFFGAADDEVCWAKAVLSGKRGDLRDDLTTRFEVLIEEEDRQERDDRLRNPAKPAEEGAQVGPGSIVPTDSAKKSLENAFENLIGE